jgi:hypothetical protein
MTQHIVRLIKCDNSVLRIPPCGIVVRAIPRFESNGSVEGVPIITSHFRDQGQIRVEGIDVESLDDNTIYIVSTIAAQVIKQPNVCSPATIDEYVVRYTDDMSEATKSPFPLYNPQWAGTVYGVRALQNFENGDGECQQKLGFC